MNSTIYSKLMMMMAVSGMFMSSMPDGFDSSNKPLTEKDILQLKENIKGIRKQQLLKNGCKEFQYDYRISESIVKEVTIVALNKKNADRKYDKFIKLWKDQL